MTNGRSVAQQSYFLRLTVCHFNILMQKANLQIFQQIIGSCRESISKVSIQLCAMIDNQQGFSYTIA